MATPSFALVQILRETADRLAGGAEYQWSHFGKCNCGHLAQTATRISARDIHRTAHRKLSEWSEIPDDFCPQTGVLIDRVIDTLFELGLTNTDLRHLEDLTDPEVLVRLPGGWHYLQRNQRDDVIVYLRTWAGLLQERVPDVECSSEFGVRGSETAVTATEVARSRGGHSGRGHAAVTASHGDHGEKSKSELDTRHPAPATRYSLPVTETRA